LLIASVAALLGQVAYSGNKLTPKPNPVPEPAVLSIDVASAAVAAAQAQSAAQAGAVSVGMGGESSSAAQAVGEGGKAAAGAYSEGSTASADGTMHNQIDASTTYARQVPALLMGTVIPVDCGFGGQAGAAGTRGAGFLGASWTTETCYALKVANAWAAIGQYDMACELWVGITAKILRKRR